MEEITEDNTQLREELKALKKLNERLKEMTQSTTGGGGSPLGSPSMRYVGANSLILHLAF